MIHLDISKLNITDKEYASLKSRLNKIRGTAIPAFDSHVEDIPPLMRIMKKYKKYDNLIVIGNGGSNTSFKAFHNALVSLDHPKKAFILTTMEPDRINELKKALPKRKTLVMPISKSGNTVGIMEAMFAFEGYKILPVTTPDSGALYMIVKKMGWDYIPHGPVGGRFSGLTASGLAPAEFFGIDIEALDNGARDMYKICNPLMTIDKNPALQLAASLYLLDQKGYDEIFCPIYSSALSGFSNLIVQLIHESVGKKNQGQTIYCADAPESQHHTNQRFFGGKKNVCGVFVTVENQQDKESKVKVPDQLKRIKMNDGLLSNLNGVSYEKALEFEFEGTWQDAVKNKIPVAKVSMNNISPHNVGEFLAFWEYVAVYSALLRGLNPYDQPQVEASKEISFRLRKEHK
ncbi:MAG: hypothetical protein V1729_01630 [Candidatus Woesearchaeota archaeon]